MRLVLIFVNLCLLSGSVSSFSSNIKYFKGIKSSSQTVLNYKAVDVAETTRDGMIELEEGGKLCYDIAKADDHYGPPVFYLPGLIRPKSEGKSVNLRSFCRKKGFTFMSADYWGTGKSSGIITDGTISKWTSDTIFLIENLLGQKQGKAVLVGHGVGAWISFLIASRRPDLVRGVVGIAADPDFTEELLWKELPEEIKDKIMTEGVAEITWGRSKYPISRNLIEDARNNLLLPGGKDSIQIDCPIRLIHGLDDEECPSRLAIQLMENCTTRDACITLLKVMSNYKGDFDLRSPGSG